MLQLDDYDVNRMPERRGPTLGVGGREYRVDDNVSARIPRTKQFAKCSEPGCYSQCLTVYCDSHYPHICVHPSFETFADDLSRLCNIHLALIDQKEAVVKVQLLLFDLQTLNWHTHMRRMIKTRARSVETITRWLTEAGSDKFPIGLRYAFMTDYRISEPLVSPLVLSPLSVPVIKPAATADVRRSTSFRECQKTLELTWFPRTPAFFSGQ